MSRSEGPGERIVADFFRRQLSRHSPRTSYTRPGAHGLIADAYEDPSAEDAAVPGAELVTPVDGVILPEFLAAECSDL